MCSYKYQLAGCHFKTQINTFLCMNYAPYVLYAVLRCIRSQLWSIRSVGSLLLSQGSIQVFDIHSLSSKHMQLSLRMFAKMCAPACTGKNLSKIVNVEKRRCLSTEIPRWKGGVSKKHCNPGIKWLFYQNNIICLWLRECLGQ